MIWESMHIPGCLQKIGLLPTTVMKTSQYNTCMYFHYIGVDKQSTLHNSEHLFWCAAKLGSPWGFSAIEVFYIHYYHYYFSV